MTQFNTTIYILDRDGGEHEIPVEVDYDCTDDPGDAWNPPSGEMTINSIEPVGEWPIGITLDMASDQQLESIEQEAWDHYFARGVDDDE